MLLFYYYTYDKTCFFLCSLQSIPRNVRRRAQSCAVEKNARLTDKHHRRSVVEMGLREGRLEKVNLLRVAIVL